MDSQLKEKLVVRIIILRDRSRNSTWDSTASKILQVINMILVLTATFPRPE